MGFRNHVIAFSFSVCFSVVSCLSVSAFSQIRLRPQPAELNLPTENLFSDSISARLSGISTQPGERKTETSLEGQSVEEVINALTQRVIYLEGQNATFSEAISQLRDSVARLGAAPQNPNTDAVFFPRKEGKDINGEWVEVVGQNGRITNDPSLTTYRNSRGIPVHKSALAFCNSHGFNQAGRATNTTDMAGFKKCSDRILRFMAVLDDKGNVYSLKNWLISPCDVILEEVTCYNQ